MGTVAQGLDCKILFIGRKYRSNPFPITPFPNISNLRRPPRSSLACSQGTGARHTLRERPSLRYPVHV
jgi:hypothetical protein